MHHQQLARLCQQSYRQETFNINECEVLILYQKNVQIVAFRGTETGSLFAGAGWLDVLRDLRICPWYDKDTGWAHAGFLKGGRDAAAFLADFLPMDLPVVCTGHSLGGALALMCAAKFQAMGYEVQEWVGFGSPKVQLSKKRYSFKQTHYRYKGDVVPLMPHQPFYKLVNWLGNITRYPAFPLLALWLSKREFFRHNIAYIWLKADLDVEPNWADHDIAHYVGVL